MAENRFEPAPPRGEDAAAETVASLLRRLADLLSAESHGALKAACARRAVSAGEVLVEDGQEPTEIGYVASGMLGMVKVLADGRRHIIGLLTPGDMYGRLYDGRSGYRIEALADSEVVTCDRDTIEDLMHKTPALERMMLREALDELDAAREWVLVLGGPRVVQRLASFLLILCRRKLRGVAPDAMDEAAPVNLKIAVRRTDLAHYLGARPESLSRAFHELFEEKVIRINDPYDIDVIDVAGLIETAGHDLVLEQQPRSRRG